MRTAEIKRKTAETNIQLKLNMDGEAVLKRSAGLLQDWAFGTFSFIYSIFNGLVTITIALVFGVYALFSKEELKKLIPLIKRSLSGYKFKSIDEQIEFYKLIF